MSAETYTFSPAEAFDRTEKLLGAQAVKRLAEARVAVFGLGGVGGYVAEALVRSGIGALDLIDGDVFAPSNLNRQLLSTVRDLGRSKVRVAAERILSIDPLCRVTPHELFFGPENASLLPFENYDYAVDAIDSVGAKLLLAECCRDAGVPLISSMGTGGRLDPAGLRIADIYETSGCPLARVMRRECRKRGIDSLTVVYSPAEPLAPMPASAVFVPGSAGLLLASRVVGDLIRDCAP